ncbi:MAG: hypothetical protein IKZ43_01695 [Acidaminococcaceae bacterium]|nr:hypothetical protein [Acidaminococcaceae bacterium]
MLKRILLCLTVLMLFAVSAFAENWTYLGRYVAQKNPIYVNTTDALILNHLFPYKSQSTNDQQLYNVYYFHDHKNDVREVNDIVNIISVPIKAKIVPLNIYGKPMVSDGVFCGQIYSDIIITNAGVFEVRPVAFSIVDSISKKPLFQATGEMQGQILIADSAAQKIAAVTGPHKDWKETIGGMPLSMFLQQN